MKNAATFGMIFVATLLTAQPNDDNGFQHSSKNQWEHMTIHGCISRLSGYYILRHTEVGSPYVLDSTSEMNFDQYVGQCVEIVGTESSSMSSSKRRVRSGSQ